MNKEKAVYYQPTCWLTGATDFSFLCACHKQLRPDDEPL
jgi:hypothetical protein